MRIDRLFLTLFAAVALFAGCKDPEPEPTIPSLTVGQTEVSFEQGGGTASVTVTSNRPWSISSDADWLAFNPSQGQASDSPVTVTVTALANTSTDRASSFRVKTDFDYKTVAVSQKGAKGEDPNVTPSGSGTASDPYNVAAALEKASSLQAYNNGDDLTSSNSADIYAAGKVVSVEVDPSYGNATYYISADGTSTVQLMVYRGKYYDAAPFTSKDQLKVGDEVVVSGTIVNFKGDTPEFTTGSKVISINGETSAPEVDYTSFEMISVGTFIEKAATGQYFRLKGKVSRFNASYCSFDLTDDSGTIYVYSVTNKDEWSSKISNGGTVELAGMYEYYEKNSQHEVVNAQILSFEAGAAVDPSGAEAKTVADFISAADKNTYFKLTGTVSGFNSQYCSFDLTDDSGTIYVYSVSNKADWSGKISNGGTVTLAGKYQYYEKNSQHEVVEAVILSFEAEEVEVSEATVAQALSAEKDVVLKVGPATVVAAAAAGCLIEQDGALIYVYGESDAVVGDNVTVTAIRSEYQGVPQLANATVIVNSKGTEITYPEARDISATLDGYASETREYVTFKGVLSISSNRYFNISVDGATKVIGSVVKPLGDISSLNNKEVNVTGYYLYHTSEGKYLYVIATKIEATGNSGGSDEPGPGGDEPGEETSEAKTVTIAEFLAAEKSTTQPYKLEGTVSNISNTTYGNFDLTDETGTVYVYGLVSKDLGGYDPNKKNDKSFSSIGINEGDKITIISFRDDYTKDGVTTIEAAGGYYVSGASGTGGGDDTPGGATPGEEGTISWNGASDWDGVSGGEETISYKSGTFTITATKASGKTKPTVNGNANDCRVYAAGTLTVTTTGDAMTSIVFNISSQGQKRLTTITANTGKVATQAKGDKTVTWTGSAKTVTFTVGDKAVYGSDGDSSAGQFDFSSIVIK